jgi:nucleotide-binding universal stress UspA family protein
VSVELPEVLAPAERAIDPTDPRRVSVALANPAHEADLLKLGQFIATGETDGGHVSGLHLVRIPLQTPLKDAGEQFTERPSVERKIASLVEQTDAQATGDGAGRPLHETTIESVVDVAHDVFSGLVRETRNQTSDLLLMGWQGGFNVGRIYNSPIQRVMTDLPADMAILKDRGLAPLQRILLPWGGGLHAQLGLEVALRIAGATGARVDLLRVVRDDVDEDAEKAALAETVADLVGDADVHVRIQQSKSVTEGITAAFESADYDLTIIGASREWTVRQVLFGSIPDVVADRAPCSVLMVRRYVPDTLAVRAAEGFKRLKESAGFTTSPEEDALRS